MNKSITTAIFTIFFCSAMDAQRFPYDVDASNNTDTLNQYFTLRMLKEHTKLFGSDSFEVEVYFEKRSYVTRPKTSLLAYGSSCQKTFFVKKQNFQGQYPLIIGRTDGRYIVIFSKGSCFFETSIEFLPDGGSSESYQRWGPCSIYKPEKLSRL
jgi:hypothetical protein